MRVLALHENINRNRQIIDFKIIYALGCLSAILVFFQANFLLHRFQTNINFADIFAICGLLIGLQHFYKKTLNFRIPKLNIFVFGVCLAFTCALLVGFLKFGFTTYALVNKYFGLAILLGYSAVGAVFAHYNGKKGIKALAKIIGITLATIVVLRLFNNLFITSGIIKMHYVDLSMSGYANNRNAFSLQVLCAICLLVATLERSENTWGNMFYWNISILIAAVYFTSSRSAYLTMAILFTMFFAMNWLNRHDIKSLFLQTSTILFAAFILENVFEYSYHLTTVKYNLPKYQSGSLFTITYSPITSNHQRFYTMLQACKLWLENPMFGAGLGAYVQRELTLHNTYLVIHNSYLWILAEFGVLGSAIFLWYGRVIVSYFRKLYLRLKPSNWSLQDKLIFSLLLVIGLMGCVHEIFYQRIFWLLIGLGFATHKYQAH